MCVACTAPFRGMAFVFIGYHHWSLHGKLVSWPVYSNEGQCFVPIGRWYHTVYPAPYAAVSTFLRVKRRNGTSIYSKWESFCQATMGCCDPPLDRSTVFSTLHKLLSQRLLRPCKSILRFVSLAKQVYLNGVIILLSDHLLQSRGRSHARSK